MKRPRLLASPSLLAGAFLAFAATLPASAQDAPPPSVNTMIVHEAPFTLTARLPGRIKASTVAEVRPQVSGIISDRLFEEGRAVEKGQPLYKIEDDTYAAAVAAAEAAVAEAEANYELAVREAERAEELYATRAGSAQKRDSAVATRSAANAGLQMAKAQLQSAKIDLDRTTITAPISGIIGLSQATPGSLVGAQQTAALTTIRAIDTIYVDVTQSANDLLDRAAELKEQRGALSGQATMLLPNGATYPHTGELRAAEPQVEPTTGMVTLRISFSNPDKLLLPGLYVEVELPQATADKAILVPMNAVMRDQSGAASAWVLEDGKVAVRNLTILSSSGNQWVTTAGLVDGDELITSGFQKAGPGAPVTAAPVAAPDTAPAQSTEAQ
ncbi:efflux RND transporter periplasmic adaptor subunit [Paracoccus sp. (in: a-proteobacteria)]|uniref:efflux RND transporter periplasmic adaptor subunit n=1 Tax=Paracoccus sp. TaxID=267 RepID=UPI00289ECA24|nr:efflux RND transporter periplasmic adaptor subunit [Paracoccus sp. (in: a-proteobacteria)]